LRLFYPEDMNKENIMPTLFIPHGGGPCFFMDWDPPETWVTMAAYLKDIAGTLPLIPKAIVVVSAHWEEPEFTVTAHPQPPLIYDYFGFPPHTYEIKYAAPGSPMLAEEIYGLLKKNGIAVRQDRERGFDHGVFIPFKLIFPEADIPIVQLSLKHGLDPEEHLAAGRALAPLRNEGVLIVGSGMSYHNLKRFMRGDDPASGMFDNWLTSAVLSPERNNLLTRWETAPAAHDAHPREEHLLPLMVVAGAAGDDAGARTFHDSVNGIVISGYRFG
jgi:aromatic ring-opening dioxygenase catalytic subunit (LigB family)